MPKTISIPYYVEPPTLSSDLVSEITAITFGEVIEPKSCDLMFIFGGSHPGLWETAARAYHNQLAKKIICTGGKKEQGFRHPTWNYGDIPEAIAIKQNLINAGVPDLKIITEPTSTNSYENVRNSLNVFDFSTISSVLAVCKSYAAGRQIRTLRHQIEDRVHIIPFSFDTQITGSGPVINRANWMNYDHSRNFVFSNLLKIWHYGNLGHLSELRSLSKELEKAIIASIQHIQNNCAYR